VIELPGSGHGLELGQQDSKWRVVAREGHPLKRPVTPTVVRFESKHDDSDTFASSQMVAWFHTKPSDGNQEIYLFQTEVTVPESIDPRSAYITLDCAADNSLIAIHVNGHRVAVQPGDPNDYAMAPYVIDQHLVNGVNTIEFEVMNYWPGEPEDNGDVDPQEGGNAVALRVAWQLHGMPWLSATAAE